MTTRKIIWGIVIVLVVAGIIVIVNASQWTSEQVIVNENIPIKPTPEKKPVVQASPTAKKIPCPTGYRWWEQTKSCVPTPETNIGILKEYTDTRLKISIKYPQTWSFSTGDSYPYSFWVWSQRSPNEINIVTFSQVDGCLPNKEIIIDGQTAYDSGWTSATQPTRKICFPSKKYLINFAATDEQSRMSEDAILSTVKFTN